MTHIKNSRKKNPPGSFYGVSPFFTKCDQAYKPSSVVDSHLSWPDVATRLTPPPRNAQGYASCSSTVLLRIGFTGPRGLPRAGELLPRLSTLTGISRRYISVALSLGSPPAAVSRYSCPEELGLSSDGHFRAPPATIQPAHMTSIV